MDRRPSLKSTDTFASMSKVTETTLATQEVTSSTRNEKADVEREVTVNNVPGPAAGITTDRSTLP